VALESVTSDFRHCGTQLALENFDAILPTCRLTGSGAIDHLEPGGAGRLTGTVRVASERWQEALGLDRGWDGFVGGRLTLESALDCPFSAVSLDRGRFVLDDVRLRMPDTTETLPVTRLTGNYCAGSDALRLDDLKLASPLGSAEGSGEIRGSGAGATHIFQARWET